VFTNDFSAVKESRCEYLQSDCAKPSTEASLLRATPVTGKCYVVCFNAKHNLTLADLHPSEIATVVETWTKVYRSHLSPRSTLLQRKNGVVLANGHATRKAIPGNPQLKYMQIFENKGSAMGCSNPHPHGQMWTTSFIPDEPATELLNLQNYRRAKNSHLLVDYAVLEIKKKERVIYSNTSFLVVCPWWATWPFETMIIARSHRRGLTDFSAEEKLDLADAISKVVVKYDNLFETSFPYTMGIHQAPLDCSDEEAEASHFHIHFYPPLLRSATVKKFMVG
jgi:UDPglucose--hexose-1-phosphate uridylyltransferase